MRVVALGYDEVRGYFADFDNRVEKREHSELSESQVEKLYNKIRPMCAPVYWNDNRVVDEYPYGDTNWVSVFVF